jgi:phosphoenolpyruvate-protein phosphotransferase
MEAIIALEGRPAPEAVAQVFDGAAAALAALDDSALRARAADLRDVRDALIDALFEGPEKREGETFLLAGTAHGRIQDVPHDSILIVHDLTPSQAAGLMPDAIRGVVLAAGAPTAHAAILCRGLGLPMVVGAGERVWEIAAGEQVVADGSNGIVLASPDAAEIARHADRPHVLVQQPAGHFRRPRKSHKSDLPSQPVRMADGRRVELLANASSPAEVDLALAHGAEGIGLLRTEFLLAGLGSEDEDALASAYAAILRPMAGRPVTVRAMDAGGDKPLPFLHIDPEPNPALGWRGIRILLDRPDLFAGQIGALLTAAVRCQMQVRLLLPMVCDVEDFRRARTLVEMVRRSVEYPFPLPIGAMIEVPSAALLADALAAEADFFSLGTNDLVQYTLACDRGNPHVASLCSFHHPAVLRLVDMTVRATLAAGRPVGVCGEAAGDPAAIPLLVGLGVQELSVGPARLSTTRDCLRALRYEAARHLAAEALRRTTAQAVAELVAAG